MDVLWYLGALFYPHFKATIQAIEKNRKFMKKERHKEAMENLKKILTLLSVFKLMDYQYRKWIVVMVDTNPIAIGWAIR